MPARFVRLAQAAICHRDPGRFDLLYRLVWRLQKDAGLLLGRDDPDVGLVRRRVEAVLADAERMTKDLRFRRSVAADGHKGLAAWYEPSCFVLERVAPHFARQIAYEDWVIRTPYRDAFWDGRHLTFAASG